ncbi:MAG: ribulose-phosphate 3-epimerase [Clostridiales bacterium]|jgi:ribulose-phosphate 3-epimerase|nr:ribulose-phosphate 3-epimerase [Clostridiales bacterium]
MGENGSIQKVRDRLLCPSMMCADFEKLGQEVRELDAGGADIFHCDIMDGSFVPNMALGLPDVCCVRKNTRKLVDAHLMIENPGSKLEWFIKAGCDILYMHPESERFAARALTQTRQAGRKAGLAISPGTSLETVSELLEISDYVLVMAVSPGFAGQRFMDFVMAKIRRLASCDHSFKILVDGACGPEKIKELSALGVDGFVLGTSALFGKSKSYSDLLLDLRISQT